MPFRPVLILGFAVLSAAAWPGTARQRDIKEIAYSQTYRLGLKVPPRETLNKVVAGKEISARDYSVDYARQTLVPEMGGSFAVGDFDGDGNPDVYVVIPGAPNRLFRGSTNGTFTDVTNKAR